MLYSISVISHFRHFMNEFGRLSQVFVKAESFILDIRGCGARPYV